MDRTDQADPTAPHDRRTDGEDRRGRGRRAALLLGGVVGLAVASVVLAGLTATTSNPTPQAVDGGELALTLSDVGDGFSTSVTDMAPGDVVLRHVRLDGTGTLDGIEVALDVAATGDAVLVTDTATTEALTVGIRGCSVAWDAAAGTCAGTESELLAATKVGSLTTPAVFASSLPAGGSLHLQIVLTLPDQDETTVDGTPPDPTVQGAAVDLTYTFTMVQRDPVTTSG
jgi:hypothetical protein